MDDDFSYFYKKMEPAVQTRAVPAESLEGFRGKLPEQLLTYWSEHGWSGYAEGRFWTVDPAAYRTVLQAWLAGTPFEQRDRYHVIARSAFGKLLCWGERSGQALDLDTPWGMIFPKDHGDQVGAGRLDVLVRRFFMCQDGKRNDQNDSGGQPLFERCLRAYGALAADEMYGFVPALALGGAQTLEQVQKVKAVEHLLLLAQLGERRVMRDLVADAKKRL